MTGNEIKIECIFECERMESYDPISFWKFNIKINQINNLQMISKFININDTTNIKINFKNQNINNCMLIVRIQNNIANMLFQCFLKNVFKKSMQHCNIFEYFGYQLHSNNIKNQKNINHENENENENENDKWKLENENKLANIANQAKCDSLWRKKWLQNKLQTINNLNQSLKPFFNKFQKTLLKMKNEQTKTNLSFENELIVLCQKIFEISLISDK